MTLLKRWTPLLLVPVLMISACNSDADEANDVIGNWVNRFSFNGVARSEAVSFTIGDKSYIGTGFDGRDRLRDFYEYNPTTNLWRKVKSLPDDAAARSSATGFSIGNKGYVGLGYDDNGVRLNDFYEFTPPTTTNPTDSGTWVKKANFIGTARQEATGFAIGNTGYVLGGFDGSYLKDFYEYSPANDTWTLSNKAFPGNKRREATVFIINNKAYFGTGINNDIPVNDFWEFDPASTVGWVQKRDIANTKEDSYDDDYTTIVRSNASSFVINNKGYITSGENGANVSETWQYDPATDVWTRRTGFEGAGRTGAVGFTVAGRGFLLTGRNGSTPYDDVWEFYPDAEQVDND